MKCSLRSVFKKVCDFLIGDPPENSIKMEEFYAIKDMMRERGCNLEFFYLGTLRSDTVFDMGIIVDDTNSVYEIMHAEAHLSEVHEIVTGRPLDRDDVIHYSPQEVTAYSMSQPGMF